MAEDMQLQGKIDALTLISAAALTSVLDAMHEKNRRIRTQEIKESIEKAIRITSTNTEYHKGFTAILNPLLSSLNNSLDTPNSTP